jgi:hypothetical protein
MKLIALEKAVADVSPERLEPHLKAEVKRIWELHQAGIVREIHFRQDQPTAVLVLECASKQEAEGFLNALPLVREGLIKFEIIPLAPYPGFARLFAHE